ncbi:MAG: SRPBCC family protein [Kangiellaceae bacterium]|jgi:carbon monoxide dehydrogenase subunit G|nr:SRPBCC family protein [Kangiellaceae bacterium]
MQVDLNKEFQLPGSANAGWTFLQDIKSVAACMPGAEITEELGNNQYKGKVKAKIGPATMAFNGDIDIKNINAETMSLQMIGKGQDSKGSSSATMDLTATIIVNDDGTCYLKGDAAVSVTGKLASLGGRMMTQVADQILNQFGKNFANNVAAMGEGEAAEAAKEAVAEQPKEINGLAFAWSLFTGWFASLFGKKAG